MLLEKILDLSESACPSLKVSLVSKDCHVYGYGNRSRQITDRANLTAKKLTRFAFFAILDRFESAEPLVSFDSINKRNSIWIYLLHFLFFLTRFLKLFIVLYFSHCISYVSYSIGSEIFQNRQILLSIARLGVMNSR